MRERMRGRWRVHAGAEQRALYAASCNPWRTHLHPTRAALTPSSISCDLGYASSRTADTPAGTSAATTARTSSSLHASSRPRRRQQQQQQRARGKLLMHPACALLHWHARMHASMRAPHLQSSAGACRLSQKTRVQVRSTKLDASQSLSCCGARRTLLKSARQGPSRPDGDSGPSSVT